MSRARLAGVGRYLCLAGALLGGIGFIGWIFGLPSLTTIVPGERPMMPNASLALLLVGVAGALRCRQDAGRAQRTLSVLAALFVLALGVGTLAEYALPTDLGLERLVAHGATGPSTLRMPPPTALALSLLASALLVFDVRLRARARPSEWLSIAAALIGLVAVTGVILGSARLYRFSGASAMGVALPTSVSFFLTSLGLLLERPAAGIMGVVIAPGPGGVLLRRLVLPTVLAPVLLAFVVERLLASQRIGDFTVALAVFAITTVVIGVALLVVTAVPLNHANAVLRESEAKFSGVISIAADAIVSVNEEQCITIYNEGAKHTFGWDADEVLGKPLDVLVPDRFRETYRQQIRKFVSGGSNGRKVELRSICGVRKNGEEFPAEAAISKLEFDGRWLLTVVLRDVTDRLRLEREVVEARKFLENVFDSSTEYSIIAKDLERRILAWNEGAKRAYGYGADEVVGKNSELLHTPEDIESGIIDELHRRALEQGKAEGLFHRRRKDGSEFLARVTITRREDATGNPVGYLLISRDVTADQRHVEEQRFLSELGTALQASLEESATVERVVRLVVGFMGDICGIDVVEEDGTIRRVKLVHADPARAAAAEEVERIPPTRDRPHPVWTVLEDKRPVLIPDVRPELLRSIAHGDAHRRLLESLGARSAIFVPLVARDRLIAVLLIASCRPGRRYGADDVHLAEEVARRAALALDNAHLYEAAREAIETRDLVLGIVAHDLRNPLNSIVIQASLLRLRGAESERQATKTADAIERAAKRMNRLIQDLLDVTRIEAGRLTIERGRVSTAQIVSDVLDAQRPLAASASLELHVDLAPYVPDVCADRDRLLQIFENLVSNAVKCTEAGGHVTIGAAPRNSEVVFSVADTGSGIAAADVPHVFDRFWQAHTSGKHGAGLGLPIVKGLVEAHGGRVWVESTLGRGSTFFFTIPAAPSADEWRYEPAPQGA